MRSPSLMSLPSMKMSTFVIKASKFPVPSNFGQLLDSTAGSFFIIVDPGMEARSNDYWGPTPKANVGT